MADLRSSTVMVVRAMLVSAKGGVNVDHIRREYRETEGRDIPLREMGYGSLEEFLDQGTDFCRVKRTGSSCVVTAVNDESTMHIANMVAKQKTSDADKKRMQSGGAPRQLRDASMRGSWRPPAANGPFRGRGMPPGANDRPFVHQRYGAMYRGGRPQDVRGRGRPMAAPTPLMENMMGMPRMNGAMPRMNGVPRRPQTNSNQMMQQQFQQQRYTAKNVAAQAPRSPPQAVTTNFRTQLEQLCVSRGLAPPEYKTSAVKNQFVSVVIVGDKRAQTYPDEYSTSDMAEEMAAKKILQLLNVSNGAVETKLSLSSSAPSLTISPIILARIEDIVGSFAHGVFSNTVEDEYKKKFKSEPLPLNYLELIQSMDKCSIRVDSPIENKYILVLNTELPAGAGQNVTAPLLNGASKTNGHETPPPSSRSHPPVTDQKPLPTLVYPTEQFWDVYVSHVNSTVNVFVRLLGDEYSAKYEEMVTNMELFYFDKGVDVVQPQIGRLYAANLNGDWCRVEVCELKGIDVTCFFIDKGERESLTLSSLKELDDTFLELAAQAFSVRLAGLEQFCDSTSAIAEVESLILGKSLVGHIHENDESGYALILYDTSTDDDVNLNEKLSNVLVLSLPESPSLASPTLSSPPPETSEAALQSLSSLKELVPPTPPRDGDFFDVHVTLAASPKNFIVQSWREGSDLSQLQSEMNAFYSSAKNIRSMTASDLLTDKYFAGRHSDGNWYRVRLCSMLDSETINARFVDFGDFGMIGLENLQVLRPQFRNLPTQAISAYLADIVPVNVDWTTDDAMWFSKRVVDHEFVSLVKKVSVDDQNEIRLGLSLVDTSHASQDSYIEKELVDCGRAVFLCV